jgi:hypothetical protein
MRKLKFIIILVGLTFSVNVVTAQNATNGIPNVAVFSPLFLDSAFGSNGYKYGKLIPSFAIQGVEYYYGAEAAIDSLKKEGNPINFFIYDSKSKVKTISNLIQSGALNKMNIIIGSVIGPETKLLADFAFKNKIAFISATYPNDAFVTNNPYFLIVNSTLRTHCKALHERLQKKSNNQKVVFFYKEGKQEERIKGYFEEFEKNSSAGSLAIDYVKMDSSASFVKAIDTGVFTSYIVGSTDIGFAKKIADAIVEQKQQENAIMYGLPTWESAGALNNKDYAGIPFYFSTPMVTPITRVAGQLSWRFKDKYGTSAGDNMYRGYETVFHFTKLYLKHKSDLLSNLADKSFSTMTTYDIQPVMLNANNMTLDYYENKRVIMMRRLNGESTQVMD